MSCIAADGERPAVVSAGRVPNVAEQAPNLSDRLES